MTTAELPRVPWRVPEWHETAACRLFDELDWVEAKPGTPEAFACMVVCAACPVRFDCVEGALKRGEPHGIWGGLDRKDRTAVAKRHGFPRPGDPPPHGTHARRVKWGCTCRPCKDGHAQYERERRLRVSARAAWSGPLLVLTVAYRGGGRGRVARPGQLLLPLDVPAVHGAEPESPLEIALPAAA